MILCTTVGRTVECLLHICIFQGSVDEIMQILDDNAMNLQSMSASRFVGPFLASVQNWEKGLSLIGEV